MRDDLHVGLPLPRRWLGVFRSMATDTDWRDRAPGMAKNALTRDLLESVQPNFISNIRVSLERSSGPDLFGAQPRTLQSDALAALRRERALTPLESRIAEHVEAQLPVLNALNRDQVLLQSVHFAIQERMEGVLDTAVQHVGERSVRDVPEARNRLAQISSDLDFARLAQELVVGELKPPPRSRRAKVDIQNEDLRRAGDP